MGSVLLVSNRLPVTVRADRELLVPSTGGLAVGLRHLHERSGGAWIGWPGEARLDASEREEVDRRLAAMRCVPVQLTARERTLYYDGFSNGVLWPLFHYQLDRVPPTSHEWEVYRDVNKRFAEAVVRAWTGPDELVWVHDYHLLLVPWMVRTLVPAARIGFFLHVPFPAFDVLRVLPWRDEILAGMLGADLVGFHTKSYRAHFAASVERILGLTVRDDTTQVDGRTVSLGAFPMGVDAEALGAVARDPDIAGEAGRLRAESRGVRVLLGIDRLDYTKGIRRRLLALERLLEREPRWRGHVRLVQVAAESREGVRSYKDYRGQVDELVGRINGAFSTVDWAPIRYVHRALGQRQLAALYRAADVMLVTPLRDGMNLVAKEFVASRVDDDGVLVLSELAGAAEELAEAVQVNPYDVEALARAMHAALIMGDEERRQRMQALRKRVASADVDAWSASFLDRLGSAPPMEERSVTVSTTEELAALVTRLREAESLLLLLDYDGTLVPFARTPELAAPDAALRRLLASLAARPGAALHVVSGRRRDTLEEWFGDLPVGLHAEHGTWSRDGDDGTWTMHDDVSVGWMPLARGLLDQATFTTPGAFVETKTACLAWHWRMAERALGERHASDLVTRLEEALEGHGARILRGERVVEVCAGGVGKGHVVDRVLRQGPHPLPTTLAMGDDVTDDDLFQALPPGSVTVSVGFRPSAARYRVDRPRAARALLQQLIG